MKTKYLLPFIVSGLISGSVFAQSNLNEYKYIIVPKKFDFLKEKDQYQLNSLTQFLFDKYGFKTLIEGESYPEDLAKNRCLALRSDVMKDSGMFKTKLNVELKNCNDQVVFTSVRGESREKDFAKAYTAALRAAFESVKDLNYKYEPATAIAATEVLEEGNSDTAKEIQQLKEEIQNLKQGKSVAVVVEEDVVVAPVEDAKSTQTKIDEVLPKILYAQAIENGFQLVDSTPKVIYKIMKTGLNNVFLLQGINAILYKKDDSWVIEYYSENGLKQRGLNVKF